MLEGLAKGTPLFYVSVSTLTLFVENGTNTNMIDAVLCLTIELSNANLKN
jgi:hypothetical protein